MLSSPVPIEQLTYEQAFSELEAIIATLESSQPALEEAVSLYERGQALALRCAALLDQAELRVQQLTGQELNSSQAETNKE